MAITIQPVDGLISRLIQSSGRGPATEASARHSACGDRVSISSAARQSAAQEEPSAEQGQRQVHAQGARSLESHLLRLYRDHESPGDAG